MAYTDGLMAECTKANGKTTRCTEVGISLGLMVVVTKVSTSTIKKKVTEYTPGQTDESTMVLGQRESSMALEPSLPRKVRPKKVSGKKEHA